LVKELFHVKELFNVNEYNSYLTTDTYLEWNLLITEGAVAIAYILKINSTLKKINLGFNSVYDDEVKFLSDSLKYDTG
jgi:hypothetical protein